MSLFGKEYLRQKNQLIAHPYVPKKNLFKKVISALSLNFRIRDDYIRFFKWLEKEKISVEDAISAIQSSPLIAKEV